MKGKRGRQRPLQKRFFCFLHENIRMDGSLKGPGPEGTGHRTFQWGWAGETLIWHSWKGEGTTWRGNCYWWESQRWESDAKESTICLPSSVCSSIRKVHNIWIKKRKSKAKYQATWGAFSSLRKRSSSGVHGADTQAHFTGEFLTPQLIGSYWTDFLRCNLCPQEANL